MVTKISGYYSDTLDTEPGSGKLVLEIGEHEIACMVKGKSDEPLDGFELFSIENEGHTQEAILSAWQTVSVLLNKTYNETICYYNCEEAMIIPAEKFNNAAAEEYMSLVFGEKYNQDIKYDLISNNFINSYRVQKSMHDLVGRSFVLYKPHHSFSKLLEDLLARQNLPSYFVKLQVYSKHIICCLMKDGKLQLIRSFYYQSSEDILYYLTSLLHQFPVTKKNSSLELSGMLTQDHTVFSKLFGETTYDEPLQANASLANALGSFPAYYFAPFIKLVL